jgi:hypothetical protein
MSKPLVTSAIVFLVTIILMSVISNFQYANTLSKNGQRTPFNIATIEEIDWQSAMLIAPQYQPLAKQSGQNHTQEPKKAEITDTLLVGIVLDTGKSALLVLDKTNEIINLTVGEGWLEHWVINSIQSDSITWLNNENQTQYIQPLFNLTAQNVALDNKPNKKKKRNK